MIIRQFLRGFITFLSLCLLVLTHVNADTPQNLYRRNLYFESIDALEKILVQNPQSSVAEITYSIGMNYFKLGSLYQQLYLQAAFFEKEYYQLIPNEIPEIVNDSRFLWFSGACHYALEEYDLAITQFNKISALNDQSDQFYQRSLLWKSAAEVMKRGERNINDWSGLITKTPLVLKNEARFLMYLATNRIPDFQIDRSVSDVFNQRSLLCLSSARGEIEVARKIISDMEFDKPTEHIPIKDDVSIKLYDPFLLKAYSVAAYSEAVAAFQQCYQMNEGKKLEKIECWLGRSYLESGRLSEALPVLKSKQKDIETSIYLAEVYWKTGEHSKSKKIWDNIKKKAKVPTIIRDLAFSFQRMNIQLDEAETLARKALEMKRKENRRRYFLQPYNYCLGAILFQQGKIEEAKEVLGQGILFDQIQLIDANNPELLLTYSKAAYIPNVLSYDTINRAMLVLSKIYKGSYQLRNAMSGIYLIRNTNPNGGKVTDG